MTNQSQISRGPANQRDESGLTERTVRINRVSKVVKGGRHLSFSAVVIVGDGEGSVGMGMGKADAVPDAIHKGSTVAQKAMINVPMNGDTIPHDVTAKFGGSIVMLKPAPPGTGVIAGDSVRAVVELAGIKDIVTKVRRSTNPTNVVKATLKGLQMLKDPKIEIAKRKNYVQGNIEDNENATLVEE
jgi:small subunit ribosomal protein S5